MSKAQCLKPLYVWFFVVSFLRWELDISSTSGMRWCCYRACETHSIGDWILNVRHTCFSSSGLGIGASVEGFEIARLWWVLMSRDKLFFLLECRCSLAPCFAQCTSCTSTACCLEAPTMSEFVVKWCSIWEACLWPNSRMSDSKEIKDEVYFESVIHTWPSWCAWRGALENFTV